jgi:hypothetical protein
MAPSKNEYIYNVSICIIEGYKKGSVLTSAQSFEAEELPPYYPVELVTYQPTTQAQPVARAQSVAQTEPVTQGQPVAQPQPVAQAQRTWYTDVVAWSDRTMDTPSSASNCPPCHVAKKGVIAGGYCAVCFGATVLECALGVGCCCGLDCTVCHPERSVDPRDPKNLAVRCLCNPNKC